MLSQVHAQREPLGMIVIGGGATGVGVAVDAAARGYRTLLLEQHDFGKGTSSRSTKLVHGGVRYLEQGQVSLVMEALKERGILRQNAPHLVSELPFVVPNYSWWEGPFYGIGSNCTRPWRASMASALPNCLSKEETVERIPNINTDGLRGGVIYYDGQFDDARLLIDLVTTAVEQGAIPAQLYAGDGTHERRGGSAGRRGGARHRERRRICTEGQGRHQRHRPIHRFRAPHGRTESGRHDLSSQGAHIVLDKSFLPGDHAIIVPHTSDGRVMFAIPWHGHTLVGTTDTPIEQPNLEPVPMEQEIEFMLSHRQRLSGRRNQPRTTS